MATTNRERVGLALELLKNGLAPYVSREFVARYKGRGKTELERIFDRPHDQRRIFSQQRADQAVPSHGCHRPAARNVAVVERCF